MCIVYMSKYFCRRHCEECGRRAWDEYIETQTASSEAALYRRCIHEQAYSDLIERASTQRKLIHGFRYAARLLLRFDVLRRLGPTLSEHIEGFVQQDVNDMLE